MGAEDYQLRGSPRPIVLMMFLMISDVPPAMARPGHDWYCLSNLPFSGPQRDSFTWPY